MSPATVDLNNPPPQGGSPARTSGPRHPSPSAAADAAGPAAVPTVQEVAAEPPSPYSPAPAPALYDLAEHPALRSADHLLNATPWHEVVPVDWGEMARALRHLAVRSMADPGGAAAQSVELASSISQVTTQVWLDWIAHWWHPATARPATGGEADRRFDAPEWHDHPAFHSLKETWRLTSEHLLRQAEAATDDLPANERRRLLFHLRQFVDATCPTNALWTNPAALRRAFETGGLSLADGTRQLLNDLKEGQLSMVDTEAFAPGRNLAVTPGKVVYRNRLIELIQYAPQSGQTWRVPLLFIPPWINKFYILDLQPKNSFVRYLVRQGFTVFMISWRNPDASMESLTFADYMDLGPLAASEVAREITGSPAITPVGYCIGGTLLAMTLAWLAARGDTRFGSATFMVSLQDFSHVGDTAVFVDEPQVTYIEQQMMERGYLDPREMARMFNLLRPGDLIWANVVNNYLLGRRPPAFDLLYWNNDGTRMARTAHGWYLRNTYVENNLIHPGRIVLKGVPIDLSRIRQDLYAVGAEKDHIVPWESAWAITRLTRGRVRYVLASSGHIAGIINPPPDPPARGKGAYWVHDNGQESASPQAWRADATRHDGSWWTDWVGWLGERSGAKGTPPPLGSARHPPLADAPGHYVLER